MTEGLGRSPLRGPGQSSETEPQGVSAAGAVTVPNARRVVCRFGAGAASAVATKLTLMDNPDAVIAYCETNAEHRDNERFIADCEAWFGKAITRLSSTEYADTWDVWERERYLVNFSGAPCTRALKRWPAEEFQRPGDVLVFGYTADRRDMARAVRLAQRHPELNMRTPLIERGITKEACLALIEAAGIRIPAMYLLGFGNNNCIPCVKATSPNYWAAMRLNFPEQFERMAALSRKLDFPLARINDKRVWIDEIPKDWPTLNPVSPACDFLCALAGQDIAA